MIRIIILTLAVITSGCSASYHLRRAARKDPSIFADTTRSVTPLKIRPVQVSTPELNDCINREIEWVIPREYKHKGQTIKDSIKVRYKPQRLTASDSLNIYAALEVECDPQIITEQLPPILLEPTLKDFMKKFWWIGLIMTGVFVIGFFRRS